MTSTLKAHALMVGFTVLLGGSFIASAQISNNLSPMVITWLRYAIASLIFIILLHSQSLFKIPDKKSLLRYTWISLPPLFYFVCMIFALRTTSAVDSSALYTTVPFMSMLMSLALLKTRTTPFIICALLIGITGALLIIFKGNVSDVMKLSLTPSNQLFLLGCLGMAINPIVVKMLHRGEHTIVMTGWSLICATFLLTLLVLPELPVIKWTQISSGTWIGILYLAVCATALSFYLFQKACLVLTPTQVSGYVYLIPLSVICTNELLGQSQDWYPISGGIVMVLMAMIMLIRSK